jgi:hypothetical protein
MDKPEWFEAVDANKSGPQSVKSSGIRTSRFAKRVALVGAAALLAGTGVAYATSLSTSPASATTNLLPVTLDTATPTPTPTPTPTATPTPTPTPTPTATATPTPDATVPAATGNTRPSIAGVTGGDDEVQGDDNQSDDGDVQGDSNQGDENQVNISAQIGVDKGQTGNNEGENSDN